MGENYFIEFKETDSKIKILFNQKKFATKHLDLFADLFYNFLAKKKEFEFDFSNLDWIAHEELVYISGILDQLYANNIKFKVLLKNDKPSIRHIKTIIYLWETWQIFSFLPKKIILSQINLYFDLTKLYSDETIKILKSFFYKTDYEIHDFIENIELQLSKNNSDILRENIYFDIDINYVLELKQRLFEIDNFESENYFHKITPFIKLEIPLTGDIDEKIISNNLEKIYNLDLKTQDLLKRHSSSSPFFNKTLSKIISKELYENAIEHAYENKSIKNPSCYLSVSLRNKISEENNFNIEKILSINETNFKNEAISESINFYKEKSNFKNQTLLQFTFLDFGLGIPESLKKGIGNQFKNFDDSDILESAFDYSTSRFPLTQKYLDKNRIPRGLFDVISIVKRYEGLIIIRSNFGKILYDFSINKDIKGCIIKYDQSKKEYFNGTIITILIPENQFGIELKTIKPQYLIDATKKKIFYLSLLEIQKQAIKTIKSTIDKALIKRYLYNETLDRISIFLDEKQNENCCIFIDFNGCHLDSQVSKKILFFLTSDYRVNEKTNVIIINPPDKDLVLLIQLEILEGPVEKQKFIYHPLPCLFQKGLETEIIWIGISEKIEYNKLNEVLFSNIHDRRLSDFESKDLILESGMFRLDEYGNLISLIGVIDELSVFQLIEKSKLKKENAIYLCSGNYYQYEYIALLEQLYDYNYSQSISRLLQKKVIEEQPDIFSETTHILAITLSSQLLASTLLSNLPIEVINKIKFVKLSNYHSYHLENEFIQDIKANDKVVVVCDVISTGYLIKSLKDKLEAKSAYLKGIISVFDSRNEYNEGKVKMHYEPNVPSICLKKLPINKYQREEIQNINKKEIIRINPATNTIITLEINKSELNETVLFNSEYFLSKIDLPEKYIKIGYFKYNNLFHPYFFETHKLFESENGIILLKSALEEIRKRIINLNIDFIFYPIFSGAEKFHSENYKDKVFKQHNIEFIPLARFNTLHGWRFTFPPKFLNAKTVNSDIFIIDDGSCTGSTIIQMIDEISFLDVKSITLLSVIGRTDDYLREFFSRIKSIKVKYLHDDLIETFISNDNKHTNNEIRLNIFFGSQWQVPTYPLDSNFPFFEEREKLDYLMNLENLPSVLFNYVIKRIEKIKLQNTKDDSTLNYMPTDSGIIPVIELLLARNQIGKINGYRFYKDYFDIFNDYTKLYYTNPFTNEIIKRTELFLSVILHEPYLIQSIQDFLPDVFEIFLNFTQEIIEDKVESKHRFKDLQFNWKKESFVSVYFILRKDKIEDLVSNTNLSKIISFISSSNSLNSLRIFFMYILNYVPKSKNELYKQKDGILCLSKITNYINLNSENDIKSNIFSNIKIFKSFLNTIPYLEKELVDKKMCLLKLNQFYIEEKNIRTHDSIERQLGIIRVQSKSISVTIDLFSEESNIQLIKSAWEKILPRLERLQRYAKRLVDFFQVYSNGIIYEELFNSPKNLFKVTKEITEFIENDKIRANSETIHDYTKNILLPNFFSEDSYIYKLFVNFHATNIISQWDEIMSGIVKFEPLNNKKELLELDNMTIFFPLLFLKDVLFKEIRKNFRHADINYSIEYKWVVKDKELCLQIKNVIGGKKKNGGKNGFQMIELISELLDFNYDEPQVIDNFYIQSYKFKIE